MEMLAVAATIALMLGVVGSTSLADSASSARTTDATNIAETTASLNAVVSCAAQPPYDGGSDCPVHFLFDGQGTGFSKVPAGTTNGVVGAGVNKMQPGTTHTYRICFGYDNADCVGPNGTSSTYTSFTTAGVSAPPPPPPPPTASPKLGVKCCQGGSAIPASSLAAIGASSQIYILITPNDCLTAPAANAVVEVETGSHYGPESTDYTTDAACAVQITGGHGGWYHIGNEPEDTHSDDVDPATYARQLHSWVQAIRAHDPQAHFEGPNLTSWTSVPDSLAYPWGPPTQWFATMVSDYEVDYGTKPPFDALGVHAYVRPDMNTAFLDQPQPYLKMINSFSAAAAQYGYPSQVWVTEGGVMLPQPASQALSSSQQQAVTSYMNGLLADPVVKRAYYFQGGGDGGWDADTDESVRAPFDTAWDPTDVGEALRAAGLAADPQASRVPHG